MSDDGPRVRVRGIYTTALTALLSEAGCRVVSASPPIRERFDAAFPAADHDARVETTRDRQGVEVSGTAVESVAPHLDVALDTFAWADPAPRDAVFDAVVSNTRGSGAVLDLGDREGWLPYDNATDYVETGDTLRVQVADPAPPWADRRPVLDTALGVSGGLARLVRGASATVVGTPDGRGDHELARLTAMLSSDVPEGWGVDWRRGAEDADMTALDAALADAADRAREVDDALDEGDAPRQVVAPLATTWCWFGRAGRFALDGVRGDVTETMAGHHRIKAADASASDAVDFVERLCGPVEEFPFDAVAAQFGPSEGDRVAIRHGKPDGRLLTLGRGEVTAVDGSGSVTVRREMTGGGEYDALGVPREAGDVAVTKFREGRWWYPTTYRDSEGTVKGTYLNVSTPAELFPDAVRYVDLHVDVVKHADGTVEVVDEDELDDAVAAGHVSDDLAGKAMDVARRVASGIS